MPSWYILAVLLWATSPPTMFQKWEAQTLPVPYATEQQCRDAATWMTANTPKVPTPSPDTKIVFVCIPW